MAATPLYVALVSVSGALGGSLSQNLVRKDLPPSPNSELFIWLTWDMEQATGRLIGLKNSTKEEIHGLITAADPDQLRLALAKLDYILPVGTSDAYVRSFASNVADRAFDNLKYIDAAGSYHNWHNPGRWIPSKKWKEDEKIIRDPPIVVKDSDCESSQTVLEQSDLR